MSAFVELSCAPAGDSAGPPVAAPEPANPVPSDPETVTGVPAGTSPEAEKGIPDAARAAQDATSPYLQFLPILIIGAFFYIILLRPQQREQRRRQELLNTLKKNDKVLTTGGMIGTIVDISTDGKMVTLRVDDTTRIKFLRTAIQGPLDDRVEASSQATS